MKVDPGELLFIVAALVAAAVLSFVLTPVAIRIATWARAIDEPDSGRRVHHQPIPRAGGLAVVTSFVTVGLIAVLVAYREGTFDKWPAVSLASQAIDTPELAGLFVGVILAAGFGFIDDRWQVRARWQLLEQIVLAVVAISGMITIGFIVNPLSFLGGEFRAPQIPFDPAVSSVVTTLWIVGMINSINFVDGLDGLSTGVSLIAALTLGVISLTGPTLEVEPIVALLCAALAGALAGFLPWNFHPARVFIGTTGVFAVGYALAVLSILGVAKVAVALLVLGVPIIDTFWIIIRRLSAGRSPFTPDRGHFHHRLLDLGLTHRGAVLLIYGICGTLAVLSLGLANSAGTLYAFVGIVVGGGLVLYLFSRRAQEALDARSYPDDEPDAVPIPVRTSGSASQPDGPGGRSQVGPEREEARAHGAEGTR